ncbi:LysE family translocator [Allosphingosinicella sp.]|jgi:threonine/homoserine/homoserine lactone efflux protein|uniref:LysE family translocator n=1 Tax=Allosphingosinicella sp. TaxID=2823234 RepID=UPI002F20777D
MSPIEQSLIAFTAAAALLTITPGLDTALVMRTAAVEGGRKALFAGLGICLGCLAWGAVVALGLGMLLAASELAYTALKYAGAAYLLYLGITLILSSRNVLEGEEPGPRGAGAWLWFRRGLFTNLLNPKVGVFYVSFLPQFIPAGADVTLMTVLLAGIHALLGLAWFAGLILATRPLAKALGNPSTIRTLDRVTGGLFLLFAGRLALSRD